MVEWWWIVIAAGVPILVGIGVFFWFCMEMGRTGAKW